MIRNTIQLNSFLGLIGDKYPFYECDGKRAFDVKQNGVMLHYKAIYFHSEVNNKLHVKIGLEVRLPIDTEDLERKLSNKLVEFKKEIVNL